MTTPNGPAYDYRATLRRVVDGDTYDLDIDLGFEIRAVTRVRLLGVNTPEVIGATRQQGLAAAAFAQQWFDRYEGRVIVRSFKSKVKEKYGRWLVEAWSPDGAGSLLGLELLQRGLAVPMVY